MMVYILCVDGSSGAEKLHLVRERASAMQSERETPNGHRGNCRLLLALIWILWSTEASWNISVIAKICLIICLVFNKHVFLVFHCNLHPSVYYKVHSLILQHLYVSPVAVECQGSVFLEYRCCLLLPLAEGSSCAALLGNQAASSRAVELHFPATGHRLIFLLLLPSPLIPHH